MHNDLQGVFLSTSGNISIAGIINLVSIRSVTKFLNSAVRTGQCLKAGKRPENNKGDILNHFTDFDNRKSLLSMNWKEVQ